MFKLAERGTAAATEIRAGLTTFLTMAYVIFVQPAVLSAAGMDFGAVMAATCVASALASFVMALASDYPVALAPAMGENFFFVAVATGVATGQAVGWRAALAAVFASGILFLLLGAFRFRERIFEALPPGIKHAIGVGIGLFIAFIGLKEGGLVVAAPGSLVRLGKLSSPPALVCIAGLVVTSALLARRVRGAILAGIAAAALVGAALGVVKFQGVVAPPPSLAPVAFQLDLRALVSATMLPVVAVFFFMVLLDTVGTLVAVEAQAGLLRDGKLERAGRAFLADAVGTTAGALLGTSTVSAYIESSTGVAEGGRTGLTAVVTGLCFLLALFFHPLVEALGGGFSGLHPVTAPALLIVGSLMARGVREIPWDDPVEAIPAFLLAVGMPLTFSIADGFALGFISYAALRLLSGRWRGVSPLVYVMALLFVLRYALL
ncbi:MAG TPA: NCS2 family permease [Myxococcaceae bacterium]|nr:NCS2 family permease [Myxococcaceae bacterium]